MRLSTVSIKNHSRLADVELELQGDAVIVGANDVGKTSLLRCLHLLLGASTAQLYAQLSPSDLRDLQEEFHVSAILVDLVDEELAVLPDETTVTSDGHVQLEIELTAQLDANDESLLVIHRRFPDAGHERAPSRAQLDAIGWQYLPATRSVTAEGIEGRFSALRSLLSVIDLGSDEESLKKLVDELNSQIDLNTDVNQLKVDVAAKLSQAMPRAVDAADVEVRLTGAPTARVLESASMFVREEEKLKSIAEQSDGVRQMLSMIFFSLRQRSANIVAIDEPELHLHPTSQAAVAELLAASPNQHLLITHSPYIVERFKPSQVVVISPERRVKQLDPSQHDIADGKGAQWWSPGLLQALTARHVLLVEGAADRVIVQKAAELLDVSLHRHGVAVFELGGGDKIEHVYPLLGPGGFGVDVIGLTDVDKGEKWTNLICRRTGQTNGRKVFVCEPDLEGEYVKAVTACVVARYLIDDGVARDETAVLSSCEAISLESLADEKVAKYAKSRGKVWSAAVVAKHLTSDDVERMPAIRGLLQAIDRL